MKEAPLEELEEILPKDITVNLKTSYKNMINKQSSQQIHFLIKQ